jgi:hypothetical protein
MRPSGIDAIAWSPCARFIAIVRTDSTIEILGSVTLERLYTMRSPLGVRVLAFSPDSRLLLCCGICPDSLMCFIATWDIQTGAIVRNDQVPITGQPSSLTYSEDGDMIGVAYIEDSSPDTFCICIYNIGSGERVDSHLIDGCFTGIWTHEESLRFAAILPDWRIAVRDIPFAPGRDYRDLTDPLPTPSDINLTEPFLFSPTLHRISYISDDAVIIWDIQSERYLLFAQDAAFKASAMAFSSDGHLFACGTIGSDIYLWKDGPGGYAFHQKLVSSITSPAPLFSPDNGSVVTWGHSTIQLWPLEDSATPTSSDAPQASGQGHPFILEFSPDRGSAAFARLRDNTVTVTNPQSGAQRLVIDVGMEVHGLKVSNNTVTVEGSEKLVTWSLPDQGGASDRTATAEDSIQTTTLNNLQNRGPRSTSISLNPPMIAKIQSRHGTGTIRSLNIYNLGTGVKIGGIEADCDMPWFSSDGSQIWCEGETGKEQGWEIVTVDGLSDVNLVPLAEGPPEDWPWKSSRGYTVTDDGWILSHGSKQLMRLPPRWRSDERRTRVWSGPFLGLLHSTLPTPVVLKLE